MTRSCRRHDPTPSLGVLKSRFDLLLGVSASHVDKLQHSPATINSVRHKAGRNVSRGTGGWSKLDVWAAGGNRRAIGARVELRAGGQVQTQEIRTSSSYLSQNDLTLHFGLGDAAVIDEVTVWRAGRRTVKVRNLPAGRRLRLVLDP